MPRIKIEKLVFGGQGLGRYDNKVCFIWNALPGEEVEFKVIKNHKNFSEGLATKIYTASPYRIKPLEDHFLICSPLQILDYAEENRLKVEMAKENYHKLAGLDFDDLEIVSSGKSDHYRNKMEYTFGVNDRGEAILGFHLPSRFDQIFAVSRCLIQPEPFDVLLLDCACGRGFKQSPAGDQQTGRNRWRGVAESGERGGVDLLSGLRGLRDDGAGKLRRKAFIEPLLRQHAQIAARHIHHAGCIFELRQRRVQGLVLRLR